LRPATQKLAAHDETLRPAPLFGVEVAAVQNIATLGYKYT